MHVHLLRHHATSTNGAPQVVATGFASLIFFMLVFPFAEISIGGTLEPRILLHLLRTDAGFNLFALALLLAPPLGILVAFGMRSAWRVGTMVVSLLALAAVPLTLITFGHGMRVRSPGLETVSPGVGSYVLILGYCILAIATGITAFRARHEP